MKFNGSDGSYDLTVNLIGLGDVIQSFKTNLAPSAAMVELASEGDWDDEDRQKANKEGMIIAVAPPLFGLEDGLGVRVIENVLITKNGTQALCKTSRDLIILDD